ncbi:MAG TPA: metalloregulator ArsR/SmtB family transcription factor [Anaerolineaceae bacterium]|nr:metalloregulator ArsR/SmtB family transcription factor [Anaerolineaceae bacterium]HPN54132.1 metalloregulator ArsR/SmtB family transcription factor [Anaerolineaceae bacterium]
MDKEEKLENQMMDAALFMLKALADGSRLTLLRILNEGELSVGEMAERLNLGEPTVSHHLVRLREAGLVTLRMAGTQRFYRVNATGLAKFKALANEIEKLPPVETPVVSDDRWIDTLDWDDADKQVLKEYTSNGKIKRLPTKQKKFLIILRWLATLFKPDTMYTESEVNTILKAVYEFDYVSLRRDLISMGYLRRERGGGKYWLAPAEDAPAD